jgi:hypothetical protein
MPLELQPAQYTIYIYIYIYLYNFLIFFIYRIFSLIFYTYFIIIPKTLVSLSILSPSFSFSSLSKLCRNHFIKNDKMFSLRFMIPKKG